MKQTHRGNLLRTPQLLSSRLLLGERASLVQRDGLDIVRLEESLCARDEVVQHCCVPKIM